MRRLYRSNTVRIIGGVCGGLAQYMNIDPVLVRILMFCFGWLGLYILLWIFIPSNPNPYE